MFLVWLGELITERGIGNGVSIIIFGGIVAGLPQMIGRGFVAKENLIGLIVFLHFGLGHLSTYSNIHRGASAHSSPICQDCISWCSHVSSIRFNIYPTSRKYRRHDTSHICHVNNDFPGNSGQLFC